MADTFHHTMMKRVAIFGDPDTVSLNKLWTNEVHLSNEMVYHVLNLSNPYYLAHPDVFAYTLFVVVLVQKLIMQRWHPNRRIPIDPQSQREEESFKCEKREISFMYSKGSC